LELVWACCRKTKKYYHHAGGGGGAKKSEPNNGGQIKGGWGQGNLHLSMSEGGGRKKGKTAVSVLTIGGGAVKVAVGGPRGESMRRRRGAVLPAPHKRKKRTSEGSLNNRAGWRVNCRWEGHSSPFEKEEPSFPTQSICDARKKVQPRTQYRRNSPCEDQGQAAGKGEGGGKGISIEKSLPRKSLFGEK